MTSNCAGQPAGCAVNSGTGFDVASFMLGLVNAKNRNLSTRHTYTEKRPEYALYVQDDFRMTSRLTLNLGLRWDVYPPWVEIDNRQSNFDETTGKFVVASDDAVIEGVNVGRYLQTYSKGDLGPRLGFAYDLDGNGKTIVRGGFGVFWNFTPGGTSSSKAQNPPFLQSTALNADADGVRRQPAVKDGLPPPPGVDPEPAGRRARRGRSSTSTSATPTRGSGTSTCSARSARTTWSRSPTSARRAGRCCSRATPNQAPPVLGVTRLERQPAVHRIAPALRTIGQVQSTGTLDYNALLVKFQRRFANNFSFLNSYTYGKAIDLNSDNDGR